MRQRAMIAMALSLNPKLIIADEPTTALDATVQAQILDLLLRLQQESGTALIMITHDLGVVADIADDVMVMYAGRAAEKADQARHLLPRRTTPTPRACSSRSRAARRHGERLRPITGQPPSLIDLPPGCAFHPRCAYVMDRCLTEQPPLRPVGDGPGHSSACWLPADAAGSDRRPKTARRRAVQAGRAARPSRSPRRSPRRPSRKAA